MIYCTCGQEFYLSTGYEPNAYDFKETSVEPYTNLLDSPPFLSDKGFPADAEYDVAALEDTLREAHREQSHHSQRKDLSVSLSSSSVSDRTGRPVRDRAGRPAEQRSQQAQIRTLLDKQKQQNLAECQVRIKRHEFQAAYDRRSWLNLGEIVEAQQELHYTRAEEVQKTRSPASSRSVIAANFGITSSSPEKSHWIGRVKEVSVFHLRHHCKTKVSRGSGHYFGTLWQSTGFAKWNKLYEWFKGVSGCWINSQWKFPRYQSTSVIPTSSNSWSNAMPFFWSAEQQRKAAKHLGHNMVYRETFL